MPVEVSVGSMVVESVELSVVVELSSLVSVLVIAVVDMPSVEPSPVPESLHASMLSPAPRPTPKTNARAGVTLRRASQ